ncbi:MAG TPA: ATP-binding cassette domain-containing protein [Thermoanaerobaculia bacterium]|nr:ATP-binding cassette domain-containing protein [Thermoanaerobaculia bacterium]
MNPTNTPVPAAVEGLTARCGAATACADVSLSIARGAVYALLGRNGAGKSSLVRCLLGQQKPSSGRAMLEEIFLAVVGEKGEEGKNT